MADNFPSFPFVTEEDWYGEVTFISAEDGSNLSLQGRRFVLLVTPAVQTVEFVEPKLTLTMDSGGGLEFKRDDFSTLIFRVPRTTTRDLERREYTANIYEEVSGERHLFMPMRVQYSEPSGLRMFVSRFLGVKVSFSRRVQPIVTPVAIAGRQGTPGNRIVQRTIAPSDDYGVDGDYYIWDRTGSNQGRMMYGPKTAGKWPLPGWYIQVSAISDVPGLTSALDNRVRADQVQTFSDTQKATARTNIGLTELATMSRQDVIAFVRDALNGKEF